MSCYGTDSACESCGGANVCATCGGAGEVAASSRYYESAWALVPPVIAIGLALITKEVYSSLFIGILVGGMLYSNFNFEGTVLHVFEDGIVSVLSDGYNVGILIFLVVLGAMVCLMNKAGGSAAFGRWAAKNIKSRVGAQLATVVLGCLIFIDDYFNCLTVGSVMRPVTDKHNVSRAKLAYLIDSTAAPICIIAPISSWAAAVSGFVDDGSGLALFIRAIPFNFYAILTIVTMVCLVGFKMDYGPMAANESNALEGDLFSGANPYAGMDDDAPASKGRVIDLVLPILVLVVCCIVGMIYSGGFFSGASFVDAFSGSDASVGLMLGSFFGLVFTMVFYLIRRSMSFKEIMASIPEGFKAMVPAIMILTFAWSLKAMTDSLGAREFVAAVVKASAENFMMFLPAIVFVIGCLLAFATGTSWGTFGILIPIVLFVFPLDGGNPLSIVCVSACMAGAVCGDHCSPISDTTIMASAGAQCDHVSHVSTQLPYAVTVAAVSFVSYLIAGFIPNALVVLPISVVLMVLTLMVIRSAHGRGSAKKASEPAAANN
ncbi:Na+/H+ antiporter NhaC family protein [Oscillibacter sp. MSJ-2]|uniref:Na+/H+ antiporter NhaC family protein n=2 Tax=Dysosmobacter acutus TaxID=2841504 RepID=A0ABS6FAC8_9FIRM|nr:Na+/H+ antiporter NhaC family protein [Dysosmobacter acutus]